MIILNNFVATGTQLKVERPGKAAAYSVCDTIEGPIVKLKTGDVLQVNEEIEAKKIKEDIEEIIYAGDVLINYGDFFDRAHKLVPAGYCEEIWIQELEEKINEITWTNDPDKLSELINIEPTKIWLLKKNPIKTKISFEAAKEISKKLNLSLHPKHTFYWKEIEKEKLEDLINWLKTNKTEENKTILKNSKSKRELEIIGAPHKLINKEFIIIEKEIFKAITFSLGIHRNLTKEEIKQIILESKNTLEAVNKLSQIQIRDKSGTFIGSRMGRPEKAKMRKLTGSPHVLFPVGNEGGRLRSFQAAMEAGKITAEIKMFKNEKTNRTTPFSIDEKTGTKTKPIEQSEKNKTNIPIKEIMEDLMKKLNTKIIPDLIKGVRGTSNKEHTAEHLIKGILRAKHGIAVNKDGTTRYDCSEVTLTHFKPKEIGTSIEKLKQLGYEKDIKGQPIINEDQIIELKVQDIVLPCATTSPDEPADEILFRTANFVDEELEKLYGLKPYYKLKTKSDLVGHLTIGLAPHTSAGIITRIIGFSKTQAFFAHPYIHAAMRRDCFTYETTIPIKNKNKWEIIQLGKLIEQLNPQKIVDNFGTKEIKVKGYKTLGKINGKTTEVNINNFTKHEPSTIIEIKTHLGKKIRTTQNHKHIIFSEKENKTKITKASEIKKGDFLMLPYKINIVKKDVKKINLIEEFKNQDWVMIRGLAKQTKNLKEILISLKIPTKTAENYARRDSVPIKTAIKIIKKKRINTEKLKIAAKQDTINLPTKIDVNEKFLKIIGLYIAEGYSRSTEGKNNLYQTYIASSNDEVRNYIKAYFNKYLGLKQSENKKDRITYSSRILYELFTNTLSMGSNAYQKRIPHKFLNLPNKKIGWLLSGYFEGDGSVSKTDLRLSFDTVSEGLLKDIDFVLAQSGIFVKNKEYTKKTGPKIKEFYIKKNKEIPEFKITKGTIQSKFMKKIHGLIKFISTKKRNTLKFIINTKKHRNLFVKHDDNYFYDEITEINFSKHETTYCLNVKNNEVVANGILTKQCDGDESCILLLLDAFLNFSKKYLPSSRGSAMDAPLVLTSIIIPTEVDDMIFNMDVAWNYPLKLYRAAENYKMPFDIKIRRIAHINGTPQQYESMGFTHDTTNINSGVTCSAYKLLPSMGEKVEAQMDIAEKLRAVDEKDVAKLIINKHFIRDTKGNLRKFSLQQFRCVACNEKFRRPPLIGKCTECGGKIIFTISEGSIVKYIDYCKRLAEKYDLDIYTRQMIDLTVRRIESVFGKEKEIQMGLGAFT
jgi:DNA polymerase II large subunit